MYRIITAAVLLSALFFSCVTGHTKQGSSSPEELNGKWLIVEAEGAEVKTTGEMPFIEFDIKDKSAHGNLACNLFNAVLEIDPQDARISFGSVAATKMLCEDMQTEDRVSKALNNVKAFDIAPDKESAKLLSADGEVLLLLKR